MAATYPTDSDSLEKWGDTKANVVGRCGATPDRGVISVEKDS